MNYKAMLQRTQEIQDVLLLRRGKCIEISDHFVRLRATEECRRGGKELVAAQLYLEGLCIRGCRAVKGVAGVGLDGLQQVGRAAVMQKEDALSDAPEWRRAEFIGSSASLSHSIR